MSRIVEVCLRGGYGHIGKAMTREFARRADLFRLPYDLVDQPGAPTKAEVLESMSFMIVGNRLGSAQSVADAIKVDSVHGFYRGAIEVSGLARPGARMQQTITIDGTPFAYAQAPDLNSIPWQHENSFRVLVDCTGKIKESSHVPSALRKNNPAGADVVLATTTLKGGDNYVAGLDSERLINDVIRAILRGDNIGPKAGFGSGSCTTNASLPPMAVLNRHFRSTLLHLFTNHSYTSSQALLDSPNLEVEERGRAAALSIVPTSTNAKELGKVAPDMYEAILGAQAYRVPTPDGSIAVQVLLCRPRNGDAPMTAMRVNQLFEQASHEPRFDGVLGYVEPTQVRVSADFITDPRSSIVDGRILQVSPLGEDGDVVIILPAWYANEFGGVAHRCGDHILRMAALVAMNERPAELVTAG